MNLIAPFFNEFAKIGSFGGIHDGRVKGIFFTDYETSYSIDAILQQLILIRVMQSSHTNAKSSLIDVINYLLYVFWRFVTILKFYCGKFQKGRSGDGQVIDDVEQRCHVKELFDNLH